MVISAAGVAPVFSLPMFEGPLDLLLHLIRENRVDLYDIPIALITHQYLNHIALWESMDLGVAGEYLVLAATLVDIKARMLLPRPTILAGELEPDPRTELVERLVEYEQFRSAVDELQVREESNRLLYFREPWDNVAEFPATPASNVMLPRTLLAAMERILDRAGLADSDVTAVAPRRRFSLRLKMSELLRMIRDARGGMTFDVLAESIDSRFELVLSFLALLELARAGRITMQQKRPGGRIHLIFVSTP